MRWGSVLCLLLLAACGATETPLPPVDVRIRLETETRRVRPGQGFVLDVVRTWKKELDPSPWDDGMLSPLVVRSERLERREDGRRIQERRRFRAYVFSRDDARVPAVPFAARPEEGGELRIAASKPLRLRVLPEVDAEEPGEPELPGALPGRGTPSGALLLLLGLLLACAAFVVVRRRPAQSAAEPAPPEAAPASVALEALARLRDGADADPAAHVIAMAAIVRTYVGRRHGLDASVRTTEELEAVAGAGAVLARADRVKFGAHGPDAMERDRVLAEAETYVRSTTP